jgi:hypothetical protein
MDGTSQARSANTKSQSAGNDARLIVMRIPNLGNHVIVDLSVDGVAVRSIEYGQTYKGLLSPGRHVLSVVASPNAKWKNPTDIVLNVRKGRTYNFTAMGDGSGNLILKGV